MQVIEYGDHIVMIPVRSIEEARGSLPGIDTDPQREIVPVITVGQGMP